MAKSPIHLNSNVFAAVTINVTGPHVGVHDIWEICILPLDSFLKPLSPVFPFNLKIRPTRHTDTDEKLKISKEKLMNVLTTGTPKSVAAITLKMWFERFALPPGKRFVPVAANWAKVSAFIQEWTGPHLYDYVFSPDYRDICTSAAYVCDRADLQSERIPFPKLTPTYVISQTQAEWLSKGDTLSDAIVIADTYSRLLRKVKV